MRAAPGDFVSRLERCCYLCQRGFGVPRLSQSTLVGRLRLRALAANASRPLSLLKPKAASVLMALAHRDLVAPFHHVAFHRPDQLPARYSIAIRVTQAEERRWKCKYLGAQECSSRCWGSAAARSADSWCAARSRRRFLGEIAGTGTFVMPVHFPHPTAGLVEADGDRFHYKLVR